MSLLIEAIKIKKDNNGLICQSILMRKLKVTPSVADDLLKEIERFEIEESLNSIKETVVNNPNKSLELPALPISNLRKLEIHISAEYK